MNTMLNEPGIPVKAVYKAEIDSDKLPDIDIRWAPDKAAVNIELWKYDPGIFSRNGSIDPISLALCFENNADERIEEAIEKCDYYLSHNEIREKIAISGMNKTNTAFNYEKRLQELFNLAFQ